MKDFLKNSVVGNTILIADFDGTLHRGFCPFFFRGIANADLGIALLALNFFRIKKSVPLFNKLFRLWLLERQLRKDYKSGKISLSAADEELIRFFASNILSICDEKDIQKASSLAAGLCYKGAWESLGEMKGKCSFAIVSKSFEFLLKKVCERAVENHGISVEYHGVKTGKNFMDISESSVISWASKYNKVKELLAVRSFEKVIIIGDTEDDIAMKDAAVDAVGKSNVLFFAVNPRDKKITLSCDKAFNSWSSLRAFLDNCLKF